MKTQKSKNAQSISSRPAAHLSSLIILVASLFMSGCSMFLDTPDPQNACNFVQNKHKQRVSWKANLPMKVRVHKDVPEEARDSIMKAAMEWNLISTDNVIQLIEWDVTESSAAGYSDNRPTIYWEKTWKEENSSEQARTTIVWSKDQIKDADIKINSKNFKFSYDGEKTSYAKVDMVSLMIHEFGHALGFGHSDSRDSVMYPLLAKGTERHTHDLVDLQSYSCEYGQQIIKPTVLAAALGETEEVIAEDESSHDHNHSEEDGGESVTVDDTEEETTDTASVDNNAQGQSDEAIDGPSSI